MGRAGVPNYNGRTVLIFSSHLLENPARYSLCFGVIVTGCVYKCFKIRRLVLFPTPIFTSILRCLCEYH